MALTISVHDVLLFTSVNEFRFRKAISASRSRFIKAFNYGILPVRFLVKSLVNTASIEDNLS